MERRRSRSAQPNNWLAAPEGWGRLALQYPRKVRNWLQYKSSCRYGREWAEWKVISVFSPKAGNEATLDLGQDANRKKITSVTGISGNKYGDTYRLEAAVSDGSSWAHGRSQPNEIFSERPSPSTSGRLELSHLSGDTTYNAYILRFHWRPQ